MEPAGVRIAAFSEWEGAPIFSATASGWWGGTVVMSIVSSNGRATATDIFANVTAAGPGPRRSRRVMRGLRFLSGATSLAGGPARALLRAVIEPS
jgi:hypothetical protein